MGGVLDGLREVFRQGLKSAHVWRDVCRNITRDAVREKCFQNELGNETLSKCIYGKSTVHYVSFSLQAKKAYKRSVVPSTPWRLRKHNDVPRSSDNYCCQQQPREPEQSSSKQE